MSDGGPADYPRMLMLVSATADADPARAGPRGDDSGPRIAASAAT